jgi:glycosyltransferase involved in cell wall biosynthesis
VRVNLIYPTHLVAPESAFSVPRMLFYMAGEMAQKGFEMHIPYWQSSEDVSNSKNLFYYRVSIPLWVRLFRKVEYKLGFRTRNAHLRYFVKKAGKAILRKPGASKDIILCATYQSVLDLREVKLKNPIVLWTHGFDYNNLKKNISGINDSNLVFVSSQAFIEELKHLARLSGLYPPIFRIDNPFPFDEYLNYDVSHVDRKLSKHFTEFKYHRVFCYGGGTLDRKGFQILKHALKQFNPPEPTAVVITGHGISREEVVIDDNLTLFCFPFLDTKKFKTILFFSDILLMPSVWFENYPYLLYEAMSFGLIPVVSSNGGMKEMFTAENGYVIHERNNPNAWLKTMDELCRMDDDLIRHKKREIKNRFIAKKKIEKPSEIFVREVKNLLK